MRFFPLRSSSLDPARNLSLEECLLEGRASPLPLLFLYVDSPCVVIGRNQNPWTELAPGVGTQVFRRLSGGGSVWHDRGNLNWALLVPRRDHDQEAELALVARAASSLGMEIVVGSRGGLYGGPSSPVPGAKVSGTARRITAGAVLHHGTLLVDSDLAALEASLGGIRVLSNRALASVPSRVANLGDYIPGLDPEAALVGLSRALTGSLPVPVEGLVSEAELAPPMARHLSWDWVYGESPAFSVEVPGLPGASLEVKRGRIAGVLGPGAGILAELVGRAFDPALLAGPAQGK